MGDDDAGGGGDGGGARCFFFFFFVGVPWFWFSWYLVSSVSEFIGGGEEFQGFGV